MFDVGFLELLICGVIALLVLGPERLPGAARTAGHWVGRGRRLMRQFTTELDRQLKADELREQLRQEGDVGLEDVKKNVSDAMKEARKYERMIVSGEKTLRPRPGYEEDTPDTASQSGATAQIDDNPETEPPISPPAETASDTSADATSDPDSRSDRQS